MSKKGLTYKESGVDIKAGYRSVELIKKSVAKTFTEGVVSNIGGFGGLFSIDKEDYEQPILVSGTDGVGTKLMVAFMMDKHDTVGEDCVAMCVNDILCQGAKPLFFLDYIATGKLKPYKVENIVKGVSNGCIKSQAALIGGETAEMPGLYSDGEYDIAGFSVGIVDKKDIIDSKKISHGDVLIGLPSNGLHSNGFSLVRKALFDIKGYDVKQHFDDLGMMLGEELLKPTRIYVDPVYELIEKFDIKGISHITGGGFYENIPRIIPEGYSAKINTSDIPLPPIFNIVKHAGNIDIKEMYSTFNMGIGLVIAVNKDEADNVIKYLSNKNEKAYVLGEIVNKEGGIKICHK